MTEDEKAREDRTRSEIRHEQQPGAFVDAATEPNAAVAVGQPVPPEDNPGPAVEALRQQEQAAANREEPGLGSGTYVVRYDGPSGHFIASDIDFEIGVETEAPGELVERLITGFPDHTFTVLRKKAQRGSSGSKGKEQGKGARRGK